MCLFGVACLAGCTQQREIHETVETVWVPAGTVIAVAPALNFSGNSNFDPVVVGDLMASELGSFPNVGVIGVNRTMAVMAEQNLARIQSPRHALEICDRVGADAILVFAITEYDAYTPVVGITAQLYARRPHATTAPAVEATSQRLGNWPDDPPPRPAAEYQQVFNAAHERLRNAVQDYADKRSGGESPYGWRRYVVSQERFLRFCCYSVARELLRQQTYEYGVTRIAAQ